MTPASLPETGTTIYYDGACPLCRAEIGHYKARDEEGRLRLVEVSDPESRLPQGLSRDAAMARFHVRARDGQVVSGAAGFAEVWAQVPGWRWAGRMARWPGVLALLELGYRGFLRVRPAIVRVYAAVWRRR